jgi:hypothetical protein
MMLPPFSPKYQGFDQDIGCLAITKYLKGIVTRLKNNDLNDVRIINNGKPLEVLLKRFSNRVYGETEYK